MNIVHSNIIIMLSREDGGREGYRKVRVSMTQEVAISLELDKPWKLFISFDFNDKIFCYFFKNFTLYLSANLN